MIATSKVERLGNVGAVGIEYPIEGDCQPIGAARNSRIHLRSNPIATMISPAEPTAPESAEKLAMTTIAWGRAARAAETAEGEAAEEKIPFLKDYRPWLVLVLGLAISLYVIFSV